MPVEVSRFLFISLPQVIFPLLASFIALKLDYTKLLWRIFITGTIVAVMGFITFHTVNPSLKFFVDTLAIMVIFSYSFKNDILTVFKIFLLTYFFGFAATAFSYMIAIYGYKITFLQAANSPNMFLTVFMPCFILTVPAAYSIRRFSVSTLFSLLKSIGSYKLMAAVLLQGILIMSIFGQSFVESIREGIGLYLTPTLSLALFLTSSYVLVKSVRITEKRILEKSREALSDNILNLINAIRSQRHDFLNSLSIINFLVNSDDREGLNKYLFNLNSNVSFYNRMLVINDPIISALLNAKITQAELNNIEVRLNIDVDLSKTSTLSFDISRILGNLIDNALDAVNGNIWADKWIQLDMSEKGPFFLFSVSNPGSIPNEICKDIFTPGYTTKGAAHSGLGLYICEQLAKKLHGKIEHADLKDNCTIFKLLIPKPTE